MSDMLMEIPKLMAALVNIGGYMGACLVNGESGVCLAKDAGHVIDVDKAAGYNAEVFRAKRRAIETLQLSDEIVDILITLGEQYHLIRPLQKKPNLFVYLVLDRRHANVSQARLSLFLADQRCFRDADDAVSCS